MKAVITEEILNTYFENRATQHEKLLIREWLKEEGSEEIFYQALARWEANHLQFVPDEEKAITAYREFLNQPDHAVRLPLTERTKSLNLFQKFPVRYASIAASVSVVFCLLFYFTQKYFRYTTYTTSYGMTRHILLEDGSEVTLNANSTLRVPRGLANDNVREVWLEGEAFFSIAKRPNHVRFWAHTDNVNVEVLGTKFNINNRRGKTEVVLTEGRIKLTSSDNDTQPVYMKPGEYISVSPSDTLLTKHLVKPESFTVWQSNKLIFEDTPLRTVVEKIEDYYGVHIEVQNKALLERQLTGTLPNNDLGIVLKSLTTSHGITILREDDHIIFR
jgi:ferric-dicitrate binding protein FerR (iron transport regulator)